MTSKEHLNIKVRGKDIFGAAFGEKAKLVAVADNEVSLSMVRPVEKHALLEVQFYDNEAYWMQGQVINVRNHLDGTQTVRVKMH